MIGRTTTGGWIALPALALLGATFLLAQPLQGQDVGGRFEVLVPNLVPQEGADDDFGKDVAEELRDLLDELLTHKAVSRRDIEDSAKSFGLKMEELDCIFSTQLATQIGVPITLCATYFEEPNDMVLVRTEVSGGSTGEIVRFDEFTIAEREKEAAAQRIFDYFDVFVQQERAQVFCAQYTQERSWPDAIRNCSQALELNPSSESAAFNRAIAYQNTEDLSSARDDFVQVVDLNPLNTEALNWAAYLSIQLGDQELGREYYDQYLSLNPGDVNVRATIAYRAFEAGDPQLALSIIEAGLEIAPDDVSLHQYRGNYAFASAEELNEGGQMGDIGPEVEELYRKAVQSYERVYEAQGAEAEVRDVVNIISARLLLGEDQEAVDFGRRAVETHPDAAPLWVRVADAESRLGNVDGAVEALDSAAAIDPEYPQLSLRQARLLLDSDRPDEAIAVLQRAVVAGDDPNTAADMIFAYGYQKGYQTTKDWNVLTRFMEEAKQFNPNDNIRRKLDFWHGFGLLQRNIEVQDPGTLQSARSSLPGFQEARRLLAGSGNYASEVNVNLTQLLTDVDTYIQIQELLIQRGG